jgi:hypothetical protein
MKPASRHPQDVEEAPMPSLDDVKSAARIYRPGRAAVWVTLALMLVTVLYAIRIVVENWAHIGV